MSDEITITLPDGSERSVPAGTTVAGLASSIGSRLAKAAVIGSVNGTERDLVWPLEGGDEVSIITETDERGLFTIRHSTAHVLAQAVLDLFPGATFAIGPPIENGFYYDFELPDGGTFTPDDLDRLDARMREIIKEKQPFIRDEIAEDAALELFSGHKYKCEIIRGAAEDPMSATETGLVRTYENPPRFIDLCRGPHVPDTGRLGHFKLMRVAGAYWRGDERNPMLQRIYGTAWASKKDLEAYLVRLEEAAERDHRKLATELDLLSFPSELGGGLAVWHPKGAIIRKLMEDYSRDRHEKGDYQFVVTPHLANANLFETSGHLDFYKDGMYPPMEMDNGSYYPKPMNCPMHCLIYRSRQRSYRELPLRLFELGTVYRYERAGTLHGLMRIRGFTQDDSHIYCTEEELQDEIASLLDFVMSVLRAFGFTEFTANLSTKDPDKHVGGEEIWDKATNALRGALEKYGLEYAVKEGDAAFYGPKIDIDIKDAIGRTWQLSTIQCDFNLPERFDLEYVAADGSRKRPIMLHRALFGSIERFFGVLLEHYAGAFPAWLAPVQVRILPVRDDHDAHARLLVASLRARGYRADMVEADEPLGGRIRKAKLEKLPYVLVIGDDDVAHATVGVNPRGGEVERNVSFEAFVEHLAADVAGHS
ncbi:MAG: threonine--tRNA ligase [Actinobacteria bacterium]|uniref:threonine--tRNA ligase n=2 Tax=freshwater metagenome TaxID=449393 RepID=A0A6J6QJ60_9ZZZZ|nr:threonine--tRNA ligase [Actinomycetota bacterium]MSY25200.1 threonine--tRNA ligase [Actinomycetota bacterium]MSZ51954.1 threonine--tRNA ligase [Actinomycetota bacterium]MTA41688.1 threonine--tRNA ligase [Actinomycetota bacterium]MTA44528.1 threonine--tRNA ligase [Actinomycetota bacterium]